MDNIFYKYAAKDFSDGDEDCGMEGIKDMFQLEVMEGKQIHAFNICNEGFDTN